MSDHRGVSAFEAMRLYPWRVILPIVVLVAVAVGIGLLRSPTYTAQARLAVGRINVSTIAAPGVVSASQSLASAYSRAISADQVSHRIERSLPGSNDVTGRISASPIPESPVIVLEAEGTTAGAAINLANAASRALIAYIEELNSNLGEGAQFLKEYQEARKEAANLQAQSPTTRTEARLEATHLKVRVLEQAYKNTLEENTSGNDVRILTTAQAATSDRGSVLKLLIVAAVVAGTGVGTLFGYAGMRV